MCLSKNEQDELIEQYNECNDGLICVSEDELKNGIEYYMDREECVRMIDTNFSTDDSIIHLTDNNYNTQYLEIYRTEDDDIGGNDVYFIICPPKADDKYKQWFKDLVKFVQRKEKTTDYTDLVMICHDAYAQTYDLLNLQDMRDGATFYECTEDHCDYEFYSDKYINYLTNKIVKSWDKVKERIEDIVSRRAFGYAYYIDEFTLIIKEQ